MVMAELEHPVVEAMSRPHAINHKIPLCGATASKIITLRVIVIATGTSDKILSTRIWAFALTLISTTDSTIAHEQKLGQHIYYTIFYLVVLARLDTTQVSLLSFVCSRLGRLTPPCLYALADLLHPK